MLSRFVLVALITQKSIFLGLHQLSHLFTWTLKDWVKPVRHPFFFLVLFLASSGKYFLANGGLVLTRFFEKVLGFQVTPGSTNIAKSTVWRCISYWKWLVFHCYVSLPEGQNSIKVDEKSPCKSSRPIFCLFFWRERADDLFRILSCNLLEKNIYLVILWYCYFFMISWLLLNCNQIDSTKWNKFF